jgi:ParB/RepB/Spo0J family partition protein
MELKRMELNPFDISFDKENPRDENSKQIETDPGFKKLKEHIHQYGLFNPIVIKKEKAEGKEYVLIDGERRLRAFQSLKLEKIPVILIEGEVDKRVLAYQLHMLTKSWSPKVLVKSINQIVIELKEDKKSEDEILEIVEKLTNAPRSMIRDILKVLRYEDKVVKIMENKESYRTFLIQSEDVFLPMIKKEFPELSKKYDDDKIRKIIGNKLLDKKLGNTTWVFRNLRDSLKEECKNKKMAEKRIENFLEEEEVEIEQITKGIEEDNTKECKRIEEIVSKKKDIPKSDEEIPKAISNQHQIMTKEKALIQGNVFDLIFNNLKEAITEFERRFNGIKIDNEKKLQNFVYHILRSLFVSTEFEDPTEKTFGKSTKPDFVIKDHKITLEIKYVRNKSHDVYKELAVDYFHYKKSKYGNLIINYIYDPHSYIVNHEQYRRDLDKNFEGTRNYIE